MSKGYEHYEAIFWFNKLKDIPVEVMTDFELAQYLWALEVLK